MFIRLESLISKFELMHCVLAFVKDEDNNLTMASTLHSIFKALKLIEVYEGTCFNDVMSKEC